MDFEGRGTLVRPNEDVPVSVRMTSVISLAHQSYSDILTGILKPLAHSGPEPSVFDLVRVGFWRRLDHL